jgi:GNAT superfamily N-acetyltransferase
MMPVSIALLAEHPHLIEPVGEMRWKEWGRPPEPVERSWWVDVTRKESGREALPVTFVAVDGSGEAVGAIALGEFDIDERRDTSPWLMGVIVRSDVRGLGVGRTMLTHLEGWAKSRGVEQIWVATGGPATGFYERCGWMLVETLMREYGEPATVLTKRL